MAVAEGQTSPETEQLLAFATEGKFEGLPADVVRESKRCILDFLGVAIGALGADDAEAPAIAVNLARTLGGAPQAHILAYGDVTSVVNSALVNGILSHVLDFDDTHIPTILHPTGPIMASSFPIAEWKGLSGKELIAAHAYAFEVSARASCAIYPEHYDVGWHMTGTTGTLGAAVACARLLGADPIQMRNAVGAAATQAAGHRQQFGAMTKSLHCGKAASNGALAALLAMGGYTASEDSLQGKRGMFNVMSTKLDATQLVDGLGQRWEIHRNGFKPYACGVVAHPAIDAVRRLGSVHGVRPDDVDRIELSVHPLVLELTGKTNPQTGLEGKFSIYFATAIALIEGAARPRQFTDEKVHRADVVALRGRIKASSDPGLSHTEAVAVAYLKDGSTRTERVTAATGTPENPISDADLRDKFMDLIEPVIGAARGQEIVDLVDGLEDLPNVDGIVAATIPAK